MSRDNVSDCVARTWSERSRAPDKPWVYIGANFRGLTACGVFVKASFRLHMESCQENSCEVAIVARAMLMPGENGERP